MHEQDQQVLLFLIGGLMVLAILARRRWQPSNTAFGTACWASEQALKAARMLGNAGLILGRTATGKLIRVVDYCHVLLVGATGAGKGVSIIIPNLLAYFRGAVVCFDTKGDLYATCARRRKARGDRIIRLAPFSRGADCWNPLEMIAKNSPTLIDSARAMAEALVVRQGTEPDPHWNDKAAQVITAALVLVLMAFDGEERSLNSVQEIASDPRLLAAAAEKLHDIGGIPARMGNQLMTLFDNERTGALSKEGAGVLSTVARHLSFLDSELVAQSVARSTFNATALLKPGTTLFLQIPPDQLEAQKGLLRCWVSTLVRMIGSAGNERAAEVLFLLDEASALGGLAAVEEALVRGRSAGVRILLAYQSDSQVQSAFKDKPALLYDNCTTQIYLGASSIETAERISKSLGDWTQVLESYGENAGTSQSDGSAGSHSQQRSHGTSLNYSVNGRALLKPDEVLRLSGDKLIAFVRGVPPILARRIKWYKEPAFAAGAISARAVLLWGLAASGVALVLWGWIRLHTLMVALCVALAASPSNVLAQFGNGAPGVDPRTRRAWREQAVASVGPVARDFVETYGDEAVAALFACSRPVAVKLAQFHASGDLGRLPTPRDLLVAIARPGCGDDVTIWAIGHAAELADRDSFDAYLISPLEYAMGLKPLAAGGADTRARRLQQGSMPMQPPARSFTSGWEELAPETKLCITLGVMLIGIVAIAMWKRRRAAAL